ncbi:MAG: hypothetical protein EU547_05795 [Promethearchaeota archaeon]|nr:MAG: hypothetical protein EU547_05795 [Candidatus Lokiarchaeota archaeon]
MLERKSISVIQEVLRKDYEDNEFIRLMRKIIRENMEENQLYRELVESADFDVDDLSSTKDLELIPTIPTTHYKESNNKFKKLLKISESELQHWNVSSATQGDPSIVGVDENDMNFLFEMARKCYLDFIPRDWNNASVYCFSPSAKFLDRIALRYTQIRPIRAYSGNYYRVSDKMTKSMEYLFGFSILRAIKAIITSFSIKGGFKIKRTDFIKAMKKNLEKPKELQDYIAIGGSNHLINKFMEYMREHNIQYDLGDQFDVVVGGGGWDGHKGQMTYDPIDKSKYVSDVAELFGTEKQRVVDVYGFTECPIVFGSHWSEKHQDFIFHCPPYARIIIRDIDTSEPLKNEGDQGFLEVLTPFGSNASVKHAIAVDDHVELISKNRCPECGYEGDTFRILGRLEEREGMGCSSIISWV